MSQRRPYAPLAVLGFVVAVAAVLLAIAAGFGTRWGLWDYRMGFTLLRWAAWTGLGAAGVALIGCFTAPSGGPRRGLGLAAAGVVTGLLVFAVPTSNLHAARSVPPINDITTDPANPPAFVAILPLRKGARLPPGYPGAKTAELQKKAYPDIAPARLSEPPNQAFARALAAARALGWQIVASVPGEGRIEAVDRTFWFGFSDDVVIRVAVDGNGSRVDIRSHSRVGRSDTGTNARRVRAFLREIAPIP
jgi:uncharacterized protein (DUF1499 family)